MATSEISLRGNLSNQIGHLLGRDQIWPQ